MGDIVRYVGKLWCEYMKIYIGSLQYSPIYKSHCCALGKQCEKKGYLVTYLFSESYKWMLSDDLKKKTIFIGNSKNIISALIDGLNIKSKQKLCNIFSKERPDFIYMHNFHPFLNYQIAKLSNKYDITYIQHVHEPYVMNKCVYGGLHQYWLYLFEYAQDKLLNRTDIAVLSSERAMKLFDIRYKNFSGLKIRIPLMYEDLENYINGKDRKYITFIGPPVTAKGPEIFLKIVEYSEKHNLGFNFMLISRSQIDDPGFYKWENLKIFCKEKISDEEIGDFIRQSVMTITPYKVANQSSVVLTSYMYGTPVISSNIEGLSESVHHLKTGYLVNLNAEVEEWIKGINFIQNSFTFLSTNCRSYFVDEFSESNWIKYLGKLFGDM